MYVRPKTLLGGIGLLLLLHIGSGYQQRICIAGVGHLFTLGAKPGRLWRLSRVLVARCRPVR